MKQAVGPHFESECGEMRRLLSIKKYRQNKDAIFNKVDVDYDLNNFLYTNFREVDNSTIVLAMTTIAARFK